jgi:hypothetical protein
VYYLAREAWEYDRQKASIIIVLNVFTSIIRYVETVLDATVVTHTILGLQNHASFNKNFFIQLVSLKLFLAVVKYGSRFYGRGLSDALEVLIPRRREARLISAYFQLPYPQQVKKGTRTKFMEARPFFYFS